MALDQKHLEALAHRFADELIHFTRTGEAKDREVMDRIEKLVDGKLEKIVKILLDEGFVMEMPQTWSKWENDWIIQCRKAREGNLSRIILGNDEGDHGGVICR